MPILRQELQTFIDTHNAHPIRAQRNRSLHVPGVPDELYRQQPDHGFAVNNEVLTALQATLPDYGKYSVVIIELAVKLINALQTSMST